MIPPVVIMARASGELTGNGTVEWCADLDMTATRDGQVTVEVIGTKGGLSNIVLAFYAGATPAPTTQISNGRNTLSEQIGDANWTRSFTVVTCAHYVRAAITGNGVTPMGSDAIVTYHYPPYEAALVGELRDGLLKINT